MLKSYGWTDAFQQRFDLLANPILIPARVIVQQRGLYRLMTNQGEVTARLSGRFAQEAGPGDFPAVGDWVAANVRPEDDAATIHHVLPRVSAFTRKAPDGRMQVVAANLDVALLVTSLNGDLNPRRLERYLAAARQSGAAPVIVLTKADSCPEPESAAAGVAGIAAGAPIIVVSAVSGVGMEALAAQLPPGKTAALLGSSGVGKSTLLNALAGAELMTTRAISGDDKRGRHTTTHRELFLLPGGALLLDSPGMRELALWDAEPGVDAAFADIEELSTQCRFGDCRHGGEPGCAIREALESGALDEARWRSHQKLKRELAFEARRQDPRARLESRQKWIKIARAGRARARRRDDDA